jgi:hypothetical protein
MQVHQLVAMAVGSASLSARSGWAAISLFCGTMISPPPDQIRAEDHEASSFKLPPENNSQTTKKKFPLLSSKTNPISTSGARLQPNEWEIPQYEPRKFPLGEFILSVVESRPSFRNTRTETLTHGATCIHFREGQCLYFPTPSLHLTVYCASW